MISDRILDNLKIRLLNLYPAIYPVITNSNIQQDIRLFKFGYLEKILYFLTEKYPVHPGYLTFIAS